MKIPLIPGLVCLLLPALAAASVTVVDSTNANMIRLRSASVPFKIRVTTEVGFTHSATLDGQPISVDADVFVSSPRYHEVIETKTPTAGGAAQVQAPTQFIIRAAGRGSTEDGIPPMTPFHFINDAPSAFTGGSMLVVAPPVFPRNLPVPIVAMLRKQNGDPLWLNGLTLAENFPGHPIQLRRGWGSTVLPPFATSTTTAYNAQLHSLAASAAVQIEDTTNWTAKSGTLSASENWGANARIQIPTSVTLAAGTTITIGAGSIVSMAAGAQIIVNAGATLQVNGTLAQPVCFVPPAQNQPWGGIQLKAQALPSKAQAICTGAIFCNYGANQTWFSGKGYSVHRQQEACFLVDTGAICDLTDCYLVGPTGAEPRGQAFHSNNGQLLLTRCLVQRCISAGEQNQGHVNIQNSAILECTNVDKNIDIPEFVDDDNDGIYLVPGSGNTHLLTKTVIGWVNDDGIDTGGGGSGTTTVTQCWFENCVHEAISNSGTNRVPQSLGCVHFNSGQGMECGYDGPLSLVDGSAIIGCMVGVRFGDNYGDGLSNYVGSLTTRNSLLLYNMFHDVWGMEFGNWTYKSSAMFITDNYLTSAEDLARHPANTAWIPGTHAPLLAPFMPVANSQVGVGLALYQKKNTIANYPGAFDIRLSTFSSQPVTVQYALVGKTSITSATESVLHSGSVSFQPGETVKRVTAPVASAQEFLHFSLANPTNAAITDDGAWYINSLPPLTLVPKAATDWRFRDDAVDLGSAWRAPTGVNDGAAPWKSGQAPIGFGTFTPPLNTTSPALNPGPSNARTPTIYFRKNFLLTNAPAISSAVLRIRRDDGAAAYLNGNYIGFTGFAAGTLQSEIIYTKLAATATDTTTYFELPVSKTFFVEGNNVLAVEVHQTSATSSDLLMDCELVAQRADATLHLDQIAGGHFIWWLDPLKILEDSTDLNTWTPRPLEKSPVPLEITSPRHYWRLR